MCVCFCEGVCADVCPTMLPLHLQKDRNTQPQAETSRSKGGSAVRQAPHPWDAQHLFTNPLQGVRIGKKNGYLNLSSVHTSKLGEKGEKKAGY